MNTFPVGSTVPVTIAFVDFAGNTIEPTGVSVRVIDGTGSEIVAPQAHAVASGDIEFTWDVPASANQIDPASGKTEDVRSVEVTMTTPAGNHVETVSYIIVEHERLKVPRDTFQSLALAKFHAHRLLKTDAFDAASENDQIAALREAYLRISGYLFEIEQATPAGHREKPITVEPTEWHSMTLEAFMNLPSRFTTALQLAQVIQANDLLTDDPIRERLGQGVLSETIGESSMMFRSKRPIEMMINKRALQELSPFLRMKVGIARA